MTRLPYQIKRTLLADHGDGRYYRHDLINTATDEVIAHAFNKSPFAPKRLAQRQVELNSRHLLNESMS